MRMLTLFLVLAGLSGAKDPAVVSGPTLGYVFDSASRTVVPLLGLPGAAICASPLAAGVEIAAAEASPAGDLVLALSAKDSTVLALRPGAAAVPVRGIAPGPDRIVFSPSGSHAAFYYSASSTVQVVGGLPTGSAVRTLDAALVGQPSSIAVADSGTVLLADTGPGGSTIWLLNARSRPKPPRGPLGDPEDDPPPVPVLSVGGPAAVSFLPHSVSALVTDPAAHLLYRIADARRPGTATVMAGAAEGVAEPTAIAVSPGGDYAALVQADGRLVSVDLRTGQTAAAVCDCHPSRVQPLALGSAFAVFDGARVLLFEAGPEPRFFFLPPGVRGAR